MKTQGYDLIGDIHGHHDKLARLLAQMGYKAGGYGFRHPEGRKVIFLGDYLDRGPKVREVLLTVRTMVDNGDAFAIMGNHELGAIQGHTPDGNGSMLKQDWATSSKGHQATLRAFEGRAGEWTDWIAWMKRLPLHLELDGLRAVHACWDGARIAQLRALNASLADDDFLRLCSTKGTPEYDLVETVLKGPEVPLPPGHSFHDREGKKRRKIRTRWWNIPASASAGEMAMPEPLPGMGELSPDLLQSLPNYGVQEKPVFVGHYWMAPEWVKAPLAANVACLDYSAAKDEHPLVGYRWEGEQVLSAARYVIGAKTASPTAQMC